MYLEHLELFQFRNLSNQRFDFPSRLIFFTGQNGHGKTSLLEAVYLLAHAKSFRRCRPRDMIAWSAKLPGALRVSGGVSTCDGSRQVSYTLKDLKKQVTVNDIPVSRASDFYGNIRAVSFVPGDLELVSGSAVLRRQFMDRTLSLVEPEYVVELVHYQRALRNRQAVLISNASEKEIRELILPWDRLLISHGMRIAKFRNDFIKDILGGFVDYFTLFSKSKENTYSANLRYRSNFISNRDMLTAEELQQLYLQGLGGDIRLKQTILGIHRDDLRIEFEASGKLRNARGAASQGQTRSLALALKMASLLLVEKRSGDMPLLLLDDVDSEIDKEHRLALYTLLNKLKKCQVLIAATCISTEAKSVLDDFYQYEVRDGEVLEVIDG